MQIEVRVGQTLSTIARRYGTTVEDIMAANPKIKNKHLIHIGDTLDIPGREGVGQKIAPAPMPRPRPSDAAGPLGQDLLIAPVPMPRPRPDHVPAPAPVHHSNLSKGEVDALVRAVAAEARGESPAVWMAVAQAIINYARKTGRSIQRLTRSSYLSSNFDGNKKFYTMPMARIPNLEGIRSAVLGAGEGKSPIGNRSHFYDTSIRMPSWGKRSSQVQIGDMVFLNARHG